MYFLLAIIFTQIHFLTATVLIQNHQIHLQLYPNEATKTENTVTMPILPNLLPLYANEVTNTGNKILSETNMNVVTSECFKLKSDAAHIINECMDEQYAEGCREWWLSFRNSVGSYKGMLLMPNYVQYYRELIELAGEWQENYLLMEKWKGQFQNYFIKAKSADTGNNAVSVYYTEIFNHNGEILRHPYLFVYNTVIHFEGQTGVFIHTLDEYKPDEKHRQQLFRTQKTIHEIQSALDSLATKQFSAGKFDQVENNCIDFAEAFLLKLGANSDEIKLLIKPSQGILKARKMHIMKMKPMRHVIMF